MADMWPNPYVMCRNPWGYLGNRTIFSLTNFYACE